MFVLYAFLICVLFVGLDTVFIKTFQLENYKIKKYISKAIRLQFAFGDKTSLVLTKRIKRLLIVDFCLKFACFLLFFGLISNFWVNFSITIFAIVLSPIFVSLSFLLVEPLEILIKKRYIQKAKNKLKNMSCKKIAITGSFGKTSTKNILYQILKEEFDVCATPKSYNTPMGVCKTILEDLKETDDFFIVEMGARHKGDIEFLAKMIGVDFGILTPIGKCHLETFGTVENIENTKYELCEKTKNWVIFNGRSKSTYKLFEKFPRKKFLVCDEKGFAYAKDICVSSKGSKFVMVMDGVQFDCQTKLLGKSNIDNIVVGATMAYLLGEQFYNIQKGIKNLKPIPHRLELIKGEKVQVIDDSYNSNFDGFKEALAVLSNFEGKKVIVSPGMVELGKQQFQINYEIGKEIAKVADIFLVMNETNKKALTQGAKDGNMKDENILFASTRKMQKEILKQICTEKIVVLFENDLPDNFS